MNPDLAPLFFEANLLAPRLLCGDLSAAEPLAVAESELAELAARIGLLLGERRGTVP